MGYVYDTEEPAPSLNTSDSFMNNSDKMNAIIDAIAQMAALNFSNRLSVPESDPEMEVIASSLNMLSEALEHTTVSKFELEESEKRMRMLFEQASEPMLILENQTIKDFNSQAQQFLSLHHYQPNKCFIQDLFPEYQESGIRTELFWVEQLRLLEDRDFIRFPILLVSPIEKRPIEAQMSINRIDLQHHIIYQCIVRDNSKQRLTEQKLKTLEEQFKMLFDFAPNAMSFLTLKGEILALNPSFTTLLGWELSSLPTPNLFDLLPQEQLHSAQVQLYRLIRGECPICKFETALLSSSGEWIPVLITSKAKLNAAGTPDMIISQFTDISKIKAAQNEVNRQLQKTQKVNQELDQFAHLVSHDLKAPLRGIVTLSQFIEEDLISDRPWEQIQESLTLLRGRAIRMNNLINGLLTYARIGRTALPIEEIAVKDLLERLVFFLEIPAHVDLEIAAELPSIRTSQIALEQVFQNLISNAIKYGDKPRCKIKIDYSPSEKEHHFMVRDNGPGIPEDYHQKVFEIFQTLYPRDQIESTGIGLSIVRKYIDQLHGRITISESSPKGTTFSFWLPH